VTETGSVLKVVQQELGHQVSAARSQPYYLDVTHPAANKGSVIDFVSAVYLIPASCIAAGLDHAVQDVRNRSPFGDEPPEAPSRLLDLVDRYRATAESMEGCGRLLGSLQLQRYWGGLRLVAASYASFHSNPTQLICL
jgi:hypothetical protein